MTIRRSDHWTDSPFESETKRRRVIKKWCNYRTPESDWLSTDTRNTAVDSAPAQWEAESTPARKSDRAPLQIYAEDTTDPDDTASVTLRRSDRPRSFVTYKALDTAKGVKARNGLQGISWAGLWPDCDLAYLFCAGRLEELITLRSYRESFRFSYETSEDLSQVGGEFFDATGKRLFTLQNPYATDTTGEFLRVEMSIGRNVIELKPNAEDFAKAKYPIVIDPTTTITGTTDLADNFLYEPSPTTNYGTNTVVQLGNNATNQTRRALVWANESSVPAGSITAASIFLYRYQATASENAGTMEAFRVLAANNWGEETSDWNTTNGSASWAGVAGCALSGTDYAADGSPPGGAYPSNTSGGDNGWHEFSLEPSWFSGWRDSTFTNRGFVMAASDEAQAKNLYQASSTEGTYPLYLSLDYTTGSAIAAMTLPRLIR